MRFQTAKKRLTLLWCVGAGILIMFVTVQTILNRYIDISGEVWEWFLANLSPGLSTILGVNLVDILSSSSQKQDTIDSFYYRMTIALSFCYLIILFLILITHTPLDGTVLEYYRSWNALLIPGQSVVAAMLGIFFIKKSD